MIDNNSEFMTLTREEKAEVITDMVETLAIETGYPIDICVALIAEYKKYSKFQIENYIKIHNPSLLYQVAFYVDGKKVYKYQIDAETRAVIENKILDVVLTHPSGVSAQHVRKIIQDYYHNIDWTNMKGNENE